ncbi:PREDICTED: uncharacterized protein LOC105949661 [Erythranthe guttata]|uniref:uncharacterized protein LOC105949661 n=1 Tax=Erythranthe guttata TaxID=4155 RepID=UPI00064DC46C|nr:PREDICTED: uncharacterized protein LOC105949661 [Erythranthe guttata]|eukprot:XP_012828430.1 PREDICTED: uncharacterized protein LOC105949661 [Erythranthe guttata]
MMSETRRLERLEKSVEKLRIDFQKLLEQSQGRRQHQHKSRRDRQPSPPTPPPLLPSLSSEGEEEDDDDFFEEPQIFVSSPKEEESNSTEIKWDEEPKEEESESIEIKWDEDEKLTREESEELLWILGDFHGVQKKGDEEPMVSLEETKSEKTIKKVYLSGKKLSIFAKVAFGISWGQQECFSESIGKQVDEVKHRWKHKGDGPN